MKKALTITISIIIAIAVILGLTLIVYAIESDEIVEEPTTSEVYIPSETQIELKPVKYDLVQTDSEELLLELIKVQKDRKQAAHEMAENGRLLDYEEDHPVIILAKEEWWNAHNAQMYYQQTYDNIQIEKQKAEEARWEKKMNAYPSATIIWKYLKDLGYNDYVCAGILGNIMAEVGGNTLNIKYWLYDKNVNYYGMCQWNKAYSSIWGADLQTQCEFLKDTIKYEFDTFGYMYYKGFNYESFLNLQDEQEVALAFAKAYERCNSKSYATRQRNALKAYNYFTN